MHRITDSSWLLQTIEHVFNAIATAWQESAFRRWLSLHLPMSTGAGPDPQTVAMAGWMILGASVTHLLLVGIDALMTPWASGLGWIAAMPVGLVCVARPRAVVAAWKSSRLFHQ